MHAYECKEQGKVIHPNQTVHNHYKVCQLIKIIMLHKPYKCGDIYTPVPTLILIHVHDMVPV